MKKRTFKIIYYISSLIFLIHCSSVSTRSSLQGNDEASFISASTAIKQEGGSPLGRSCKLSKAQKGLRIAGSILLGAGAVGLIVGGVLYSKGEVPVEGPCTYPGGEASEFCILDFKPTGSSLMGLGGIGLGAGGLMLGFSFAPWLNSPCSGTP